ncbi:MAG: ATP-binding protein [Desulfobacterales bacterium]
MSEKGKFPDTNAELRREAEKIAREKAANASDELTDLPAEESRRMLHELRIHQIELEMQNEELRRTQAELHASQARYFDLYDLAPVGYFTISEKGFILEANLTAATLLNAARGALAGHPISRYIIKEDQDIYYLHRKKLIKTGEQQSCELRMARGDNPPFWARLDATVAWDENGTPFCRMVMTDISRRKQAETELMQLNDNLEQRVEERTRLIKDQAGQLRSLAVELIKAEEKERRRIAGILHNDLQQILASAKLHLQEACHDLSARPELKKVDDMLKASIQKSRSLSAELSPVIVYHSGLNAALKWLISRMKEQFGLEVQLDTDEAYAIEDESLRVFLFRAVQELLFNTAKHSGVNSARVVLSAADQIFTIRVSDPGRGFDPETINDSNANKGIGLLSLRERAKAMGGSLSIESRPGKGCCFTLSVPFPVSKGKPDEGAPLTY